MVQRKPLLMNFKHLKTYYVILTIIGATLTILLIWWGYKYYRKRNEVALKERYSIIALWETVCSCIFLTMESTGIMSLMFNIGNQTLIDEIFTFFINTFLSFFVFCWILRFWLIIFQMKHTIALTNQQWMHIINPNSIQLTQLQFYLQKNKTYGNLNWCKR
eukprot:17940_1